jgi:hypothetical protein
MVDGVAPPDAPNAVFPRTPEAMDTFETAVEGIKGGLDAAKEAATGSDLKATLQDLQSWDDKTKSGTVLGLTCLAFYLSSGDDGYNLLTVVSVLLIVRLLTVSACRATLETIEKRDDAKLKSVASLVERIVVLVESIVVIPSPSSVHKIISGFASLVESRINKTCKYLVLATEPTDEGKRAFWGALAHLVGLIALLRFFSVSTLFFVYVIYQMTYPPVYSRHQDKIDAAVEKVKVAAEPHVATIKVKAAIAKGVAAEKLQEALSVLKAKLEPHMEKLLAKINKRTGGAAVSEEEEKPLVGEKTE